MAGIIVYVNIVNYYYFGNAFNNCFLIYAEVLKDLVTVKLAVNEEIDGPKR